MKRHLRKIKEKISIERVLLTRLKVIGSILCGLSVVSLTYALSHHFSENHEEEFEALTGISLQEDSLYPDISPHEAFNFFIVALVFLSIGFLCFYFSWKRTKSLQKKKK